MALIPRILLTTLLASSAFSRSAASAADGPVISEPSRTDTYTAQAGTTIDFRCSGSQPVVWHADHYKDLLLEAETVSSSTATQLGSHIRIHKVSVNHVGYFTCSYLNCNSSTSCSSRIYLYVKDEENLLPMDRVYFLKVPSNQDFMIPCKPSFPGVEVTLTQADGTEVSLDFDPREGFHANRSTFTYVRVFTCVGTYGTLSSTSMIKDVKEPYPPRMDVTDAWQTRHANVSCYDVLEGMTVRLHCIGTPGSDGTARWQYTASPEQETRFRTERYDLVTTLVIERARVEDSGAYHCYMGNMFFNSTDIPAFIQVFKNDSADVSFFDTSNDIHLSKMDEVIKWYILFEAHPQIPSFTWTQRGQVLVNTTAGASQAVAGRHLVNVTRQHGTVLLRIARPNMGDVGQHSLTACVESPYRVCKNISFSLTVLGGPEEVRGRVDGSSNIVLANSSVEVICRALGHPRPGLSLLFAPCHTPSNCSQYQNVTNVVQNSSCPDAAGNPSCNLPITAAVVKYRLPHTTPGKFICHAHNEHGSANSTEESLVVVEHQTSDLQPLRMSFKVLDGPPLGKCRNTSGSPDLCTVYAPATVALQCQANIFHFSDNDPLLFSGRLPSCQAASKCSDLSPLEAVNQFSTALTRVASAQLEVAPDAEACRCYECLVPSSNVERSNEKFAVNIRVEEKITPYFVKNLAPTKELVVHKTLELECSVKGRPLPRILWFKNDKEVLSDQDRISIERDGQSLTIDHLTVEDSGRYVCETDPQFNTASIRQSTEVTVTDPDARSKTFLLYAVISFSVVLGIIIVIFIVYIFVHIKKQKMANELAQNFEDGDPDKLTPDMGLTEQAALLPIKKSFEFPRSKLEYERLLGQGAFGMVYRARVRGQIAGQDNPIVAVKKVKSPSNPVHLKGLESEVKIMMHIGKHPNIVNLLGICTARVRSGELQIIVEYCKHGNLLDYMHSIKGSFINSITLGGTLRSYKKSMSNTPTVNYANLAAAAAAVETSQEHSSSSAVTVLRRANSISSSTISSQFVSSRPEQKLPLSLPNSPTYNVPQPAFIQQNGSVESYSNTIPRSNTISSADRSTLKIGSTDLTEVQREKDITTYTLVDWCYQIARGMDYLSRHKVLHGDLAARNILLAENNVVKISDFGLSKQLYNYEYKTERKGPKPVRWMAIEALRDGVYSTQSDVWAYGVVMWEIFSLGQVPYPTIEINTNFVNQLESGTRLEKPPYASDGLYDIMSRCWLENACCRPLFDELQSLLLNFMDPSQVKQYENINCSISTQLENSLLNKVRSPDIRCMVAANDDDGYEVPMAAPNPGSSEGGMSRRNIHSLSIPANPTNDDNLDSYCPMTGPCDNVSPLPQFSSKMSLSAIPPQRTIRSPHRLRSISVSPTIHEETVFNFPPADAMEATLEYRKGGHDSGIYTPGPMVCNREYFDFEQTTLTSPQVKNERAKGLRRESEASSGTGSLGGPSRESIISSLPSQPIIEEQIPLVCVQR